MKKLKYIITATLTALVVSSCNKLDVAPKNIITDQAVFSSNAGVTAYLAGIYKFLPMEDFIYRNDGSFDPNNNGNNGGFSYTDGGRWQCFYHPGSLSGELVGPYGGTGDAAQGFGYWPYNYIRNINYFLVNLPVESTATADQKNSWLGEAYFLRAYFYFSLVKRYGGVPIIKTPQDPTASAKELQVPRDKEEDVYNFIGADLDQAYNLMPATSDRGRANKYVAAAFKSRVMLYAATIAKYGATNFVAGDAQSKGFVGIPAADANKFFQASYDAAKLVEGHYTLYSANADKEQNYVDAFLDQNSPENILVRDYSKSTGTAHSYDATFSPRYMTADGLSRAYPTMEFVERFTLLNNITNADGTPHRFDNLADVAAGLEPRLRATVYFPGATLRGYTFDVQRGLYDQFSGTAAAEIGLNPPNLQYQHLAGSTDATYNGLRIIGFTGISTNGDDLTRTGLYVRKYVNYKAAQADCGLYASVQSWIDIRYAEVMLNRAEASYELGNTGDALDMINQIRTRAGAKLAGANFTLDTVRNERCKELAFEKHYWWDIRRWRTADKVLDNTKFHALLPFYIINEKKYIFLRNVEPFQRVYTFDKKFYYEPLPGGELGKDPNLYPNNPGY